MSYGYQDLYRLRSNRGNFKWDHDGTPILDPDELRVAVDLLSTNTSSDDELEFLESVARQYIGNFIDMPATTSECTDYFARWDRQLPLSLIPSEDPTDALSVNYRCSATTTKKVAASKVLIDRSDTTPMVVFTQDPTYDLYDRINYPISVTYESGASVYNNNHLVTKAVELLVAHYWRYDDTSIIDPRVKSQIAMLLNPCRRSRQPGFTYLDIGYGRAHGFLGAF